MLELSSQNNIDCCRSIDQWLIFDKRRLIIAEFMEQNSLIGVEWI